MNARRRALALLVALAATIAGCAPRERGVTLRFWGMGREGEVVEQLVPAFEREHPGVRVIVQQIPWSAAHEKLLTAHVGRATPDVSQLGNTWVPEFAALRAIEPLEGSAAAGAIRPETFFGGIWDTNVIDGRAYGVPWYVDTRVLFYRRDLLRQAGYDHMPQDWAGWREAMRAVKKVVGPDRYAIFLPLNEWNPPVIFGLQAGSRLLADGDTRAAFGDSAFRRGFDFYLGLFREGLAPPVTGNEIANAYQEFARGYVTMWITGPWNLGEFRRRLPPEQQDAWATAPMPGPTGAASGVSLAGGSSLVVFRGSKHQAEAWAFVEYLSRPEVQLEFWRLTGDLPGRVEAWRDSALTADPNVRAFGTQLERVVAMPKVPECEQIAIRLQDWVERTVRGSVPPDAALAGLSAEVDRMLEKRRWLRARALAAGAKP